MDGRRTLEAGQRRLLEADGGPLSHGDKVPLFVAWALWNGKGGITLSEIVETLIATTSARWANS